MWGAFLSEPLRIVGTVGRYPAVYLMRRMPVPRRIAPFNLKGCPSRCYAVLGRISPGYPPAGGGLHTCYSPVRRSPAPKSEDSGPLPLDLHVLSLSLAFILSQDQTLRCLFFFSLFSLSLRRSPVENPSAGKESPTHQAPTDIVTKTRGPFFSH